MEKIGKEKEHILLYSWKFLYSRELPRYNPLPLQRIQHLPAGKSILEPKHSAQSLNI